MDEIVDEIVNETIDETTVLIDHSEDTSASRQKLLDLLASRAAHRDFEENILFMLLFIAVLCGAAAIALNDAMVLIGTVVSIACMLLVIGCHTPIVVCIMRSHGFDA